MHMKPQYGKSLPVASIMQCSPFYASSLAVPSNVE